MSPGSILEIHFRGGGQSFATLGVNQAVSLTTGRASHGAERLGGLSAAEKVCDGAVTGFAY